MRFAAAPEYHVFPTQERPLKPYEAVRRAATTTRELVVAERPDVVVHDILTLAPALAAELEGVPRATLIPHLDPRGAPGWPPYSIGARLPRTGVGRAFWGLFDPLLERGLQLGRRELNETRSRLGLPPQAHVHGGISRELAIVVTFPQLGVPARGAGDQHAHRRAAVVGAAVRAGRAAAGTDPLVLVAPSTAQDHEGVMLRAALAAMADLPVRVIATTNKRGETGGYDVPANARLVDWLSYSRTMPQLRPRRLPRRPRHADARAEQRRPRRRLPRGGRHERERRPRRLGRRRRPPAPPPDRPPRPAPGDPEGARRPRPPRARQRRQALPHWSSTPRPGAADRTPADSSRTSQPCTIRQACDPG